MNAIALQGGNACATGGRGWGELRFDSGPNPLQCEMGALEWGKRWWWWKGGGGDKAIPTYNRLPVLAGSCWAVGYLVLMTWGLRAQAHFSPGGLASGCPASLLGPGATVEQAGVSPARPPPPAPSLPPCRCLHAQVQARGAGHDGTLQEDGSPWFGTHTHTHSHGGVSCLPQWLVGYRVVKPVSNPMPVWAAVVDQCHLWRDQGVPYQKSKRHSWHQIYVAG